MFKKMLAYIYENFPRWGLGVRIVWLRNWLHFRYTLVATLFWVLLEPLFYLAAIGYGIGSFVSNIQGQSYAEFYFPALLATTAMMVPFFESTYGNYTKMTWQKTYSTILYTPIGVDEIFLGEILWSTTKGFMSVLGVTVVAFFFNAFDSWLILPSFFILLLVSMVFSVLGMLFTTLAKNYDSFIYTTSGLIIPFSLFSGTYFPLENLPSGIRWLAYISPLTHGVAAVRSTLKNEADLFTVVHVLVLMVMILGLLLVTKNRFQKKLIY